MNEGIQHFLLVYDRHLDRLVEQREFGGDAESALLAYREAERRAARNGEDQLDIVLVGSDSIETVMATHGNYFSGRARQSVDHLLEIAVS